MPLLSYSRSHCQIHCLKAFHVCFLLKVFFFLLCLKLPYYIFLLLLIYLFWLRWVFIAACGLSLVVASGGYSLLQCSDFSLRWFLLLQSTGPRVHRLAGSTVVMAHGLSCPATCGIFQTRNQPWFPALAGGFLITGSLKKSSLLRVL